MSYEYIVTIYINDIDLQGKSSSSEVVQSHFLKQDCSFIDLKNVYFVIPHGFLKTNFHREDNKCKCLKNFCGIQNILETCF